MKAALALSFLGLIGCAHQKVATNVSEEDYSFLSVTQGPCLPKIGAKLSRDVEAQCRQMTEPRRYRGRWHVAFETSYFTPVGMQSCIETKGLTQCAELVGKSLPWPGRWDCAREYEVEFIGRRNVLPGFNPPSEYTIVVDQVISAKRLPDPYDENCDPELHPELKAKN